VCFKSHSLNQAISNMQFAVVWLKYPASGDKKYSCISANKNYRVWRKK